MDVCVLAKRKNRCKTSSLNNSNVVRFVADDGGGGDDDRMHQMTK